MNRTPSVVMTAAVIEELSGLGHTRTCCRRAEVATLLRFAEAVHVVAGQVVLSAEVDGDVAGLFHVGTVAIVGEVRLERLWHAVAA